MRIIPLFIFLFLCLEGVLCQSFDCNSSSGSFGESKNCNLNIYEQNWSYQDINALSKAVFKYSFNGFNCTGTLINQNVSDANLKQYFVTSWHCLKDGDFNDFARFYFNYQSPDESNDDTPLENRGYTSRQSNPFSGDSIECGYEYYLQSQMRLIKNTSQINGDFALCEIIEPIPKHFNIYYAGWYPKQLYKDTYHTPYIDIHHPRGDIKKISRTWNTIKLENQIATGCYTVTTIINNVLGWLGVNVNTSVICNYVDVPFMEVPVWTNGTTEHGSSGSTIINRYGKVVGTESGSPLALCPGANLDAFGKFHRAYNYAAVWQALNPNNNQGVNLTGMAGRYINCYNELLDLSGQYFPASDYQSENHIVLSSQNDITTSSSNELRIYPGAKYTFKAGGKVVLRQGFTATSSCNFKAVSGTTCYAKEKDDEIENNWIEMEKVLSEIKIPEFKEFPCDRFFNSIDSKTSVNDEFFLNVFPNPAKDNLHVTLSFAQMQEKISVVVIDIMGSTKYYKEFINMQNGVIIIPLNDMNSGLYNIQIVTSKQRESKNIIIKR